MRLDGFGLFVDDMAKMIRFYKDVLGFEIKEEENTSNVYLVKDGTLFLLYGRNDFEKMPNRRYEYIKGLNGHSEIALYVDTFEEVDEAYKKAVENGATSVLEPELEPWGQRTCYIVHFRNSYDRRCAFRHIKFFIFLLVVKSHILYTPSKSFSS